MSSDNLGSSSAASSCTLCCGVIDLIFTSCGTWRYWDCYHKLVLTIILSGSACHNTACADRNPISVFAPPTNTNNTLLWPPQSWDPQTPLMGGNSWLHNAPQHLTSNLLTLTDPLPICCLEVRPQCRSTGEFSSLLTLLWSIIVIVFILFLL